jgi:hypothetical protein
LLGQGSLSVEGQEPVIYLYVCRSINKMYIPPVQTDHDERVMGD